MSQEIDREQHCFVSDQNVKRQFTVETLWWSPLKHITGKLCFQGLRKKNLAACLGFHHNILKIQNKSSRSSYCDNTVDATYLLTLVMFLKLERCCQFAWFQKLRTPLTSSVFVKLQQFTLTKFDIQFSTALSYSSHISEQIFLWIFSKFREVFGPHYSSNLICAVSLAYYQAELDSNSFTLM